jgi:hypothetical protein
MSEKYYNKCKEKLYQRFSYLSDTTTLNAIKDYCVERDFKIWRGSDIEVMESMLCYCVSMGLNNPDDRFLCVKEVCEMLLEDIFKWASNSYFHFY